MSDATLDKSQKDQKDRHELTAMPAMIPRKLAASPIVTGDATIDRIIRANPHVAQFYAAKLHKNAEIKPIPFSRKLDQSAPHMPYRSRCGETKTTLHWGQRKLLLSEIEFLTLFADEGDTVVYAGAAPGSHTNYLSSLFPSLTFVLVDPNDFTCTATDKIHIRQTFFTDETAKEFAGKGVLFISDIRTADPSRLTAEETEAGVMSDQENQMRWHDILRPKRSMLKFRLPWNSSSTEYLDGNVFLPIWGPLSTTETRLVPSGHGRKKWDNKLYEEQMFYFNTVTRVQIYKHSVQGEGIDGCFDCRSECHVLMQYCKKFHPPILEKCSKLGKDAIAQETCTVSSASSSSSAPTTTTRQGLVAMPSTHPLYSAWLDGAVSNMSYEISRAIKPGRRTLLDPNPDPEVRQAGLNRRKKFF